MDKRVRNKQKRAPKAALQPEANTPQPAAMPKASTNQTDPQTVNSVSRLLKLEQQLINALSDGDARIVMVNDLQSLVNCEQAVLIDNLHLAKPVIRNISNIAEVDKTSPFVSWMASLVKSQRVLQHADRLHEIKRLDVPEYIRRDWKKLAFPNLLWMPLQLATCKNKAVLVLGRSQPWQAHELAVLEHLSGMFAYRLFSKPVGRFSLTDRLPSKLALVFLLMTFSSFFIPVRLNVLAPAQISAAQPSLVTAPFDGVVSSIIVEPGQQVKKGQTLVQMDQAELQNLRDIIKQELAVSRAELHKMRQAGFADPGLKSRIAELQASVELKQIELKYAEQNLQQAEIKAGMSGIAIVDFPEQWKGKPVQVGERLLTVANPQNVEISIHIPVKDSIALQQGADVELFLDTAPLTPLQAKTTNAAYEPAPGPDNQPAYLVKASLPEIQNKKTPRIGLRGTAKIYGQQVSLFYYLLRRPITAFRQWLGW